MRKFIIQAIYREDGEETYADCGRVIIECQDAEYDAWRAYLAVECGAKCYAEDYPDLKGYEEEQVADYFSIELPALGEGLKKVIADALKWDDFECVRINDYWKVEPADVKGVEVVRLKEIFF